MADVTRQEANDLLTEAHRTAQLVQRRAPKEYLPFYIWGLFHLLVIPWFDVVDPHLWGLVTIAVAAVAFLGTCGYFARASDRARVRERSPWWAWPTFTAGAALLAALAAAFGDQVRLPYTLAGVLIALPLLAWGTHLRRTA